MPLSPPVFVATAVALLACVAPAQRAAADHWSWRPLVRPAPPATGSVDDATPLDAFVAARLPAGVRPAPAADRATLLRRASLDLTGLPPTLAELDAAESDPSPDWFARAVDRLLASPGYAERWASWWLDLARYADTQGYEKDNRRTIWRYRDFVIDAFDRDLPFDEFTIWQLAGDLLPDATPEQRLATAFHRNTMTNTEGGTDDEEFRVAAVVDRVNTTLEVWMATTIGCAQCHDHKYDPITQREYYELFAFFDQTADADRDDDAPTIETPTPEQSAQLAAIDTELARLRARLAAPPTDAERREFAAALRERAEQLAAADLQLGAWQHAGPFPAASFRAALAAAAVAETAPAAAQWSDQADWTDGRIWNVFPEPNAAHYLRRRLTVAADCEVELLFGSDDALRVWLDGERVHDNPTSRGAALDQDRVAVHLTAGEHELLVKIVNGGGPGGFAFRVGDGGVDAALLAAARGVLAGDGAAERARLDDAWRDTAPTTAPLRDAIAALDAEHARLAIPRTPVMVELPADRRRTTRIHRRGSFLDQGDVVSPGVPALFHDWRPEWPRDRLGLARWLVDPRNPLTARVLANRLWEQLFGTGLVATTEEFGTQGEPPSHPELLDWLASELVANGWSIKRTLRTIVLSHTWRQDSALRTDVDDPHDRLLARGPARRLEAETLRDQALAVAGLLSPKRYGPSVMPPQPDGVWSVVYSGDRWITSAGEDRHRRGVYTFWRRTSPHPAMVAFDAPSREFCVLRRGATNTPLQALVAWNDPEFVEAAQALARRVLRDGGATDDERVDFAVRTVTARHPSPAESARLQALLAEERRAAAADPDAARELAASFAGPLPGDLDLTDAAAWTVACNVLLCLDEVIRRR
ncbi:MAG: DUF1553 domain-containing protein [Planctomycetes bacterium]|nr:DUF1553 domain-containing protein [Planctomycetota bacterium]